MKKGMTVLEYVVIAIVVIAFAAIVLYAFVPRLERAPQPIERLLPERCAFTGKTQEEYLVAIENALLEKQMLEAFDLSKEMRVCFPEAELPEYQRVALYRMVSPKLEQLRDKATSESLNAIKEVYYGSKGAIPINEWKPEDLIAFARALHFAKDNKEDAEKILNEVLRREKVKGTIMEAEALYELAALNPGSEKSEKIFERIIKDYGNKDGPEFKFFVGLAKIELKKTSEGLKDLKAAQKSENDYIKNGALYHYFLTLSKDNPEDAAKKFEGEMAWKVEFKKTRYYQLAVKKYSEINENNRKYKKCKYDERVGVPCLCTINQLVLLPENNNVYCCKGFVSQKSCAEPRINCEEFKTCEDYGVDKRLCDEDPCEVAKLHPQDEIVKVRCLWLDAKCSTLASFI